MSVSFEQDWPYASSGHLVAPSTYTDPMLALRQAMWQSQMQAYMALQQAQLAAQMAMQEAAMKAQMTAQAAAAAAMAKMSSIGTGGGSSGMAGGKMGWITSARFEDPVGGDIDFYHNRLCFDGVCKYDPEGTEDINMEWLRRAIPMREYPYREEIQPPQRLWHRPDQRYSLIPFEDIRRVGWQKVYLPNAHTPLSFMGMDKAGLTCLPLAREERMSIIRNFI